MKGSEGIVLLKNYGKVKLKLKQYMDEQGITRNRLARMIDTRFEVIDKWYKGQLETVDLDILARICFVLKCQIFDLMEYDMTEETR